MKFAIILLYFSRNTGHSAKIRYNGRITSFNGKKHERRIPYYKRTVLVGFAFFLICAFWQIYDVTIAMTLTSKFGLTPTVSGIFMDKVAMTSLFPYASIFVGLAFFTMMMVKHGDSKVTAKKGLEALDIDD